MGVKYVLGDHARAATTPPHRASGPRVSCKFPAWWLEGKLGTGRKGRCSAQKWGQGGPLALDPRPPRARLGAWSQADREGPGGCRAQDAGDQQRDAGCSAGLAVPAEAPHSSPPCQPDPIRGKDPEAQVAHDPGGHLERAWPSDGTHIGSEVEFRFGTFGNSALRHKFVASRKEIFLTISNGRQ